MEHKIKLHKGMQITYDDYDHNFKAMDEEGNAVLSNEKQDLLEAAIDRYTKASLTAGIEVIKCSYGDPEVVKITSINPDSWECWYSNKGKTGYGSRGKQDLRHDSPFYELTPENERVLVNLAELDTKIQNISEEASQLRKSLKNKLTLQDLIQLSKRKKAEA